MAIYSFVWNMLAWSVTIAILIPITIPWGLVAYKIWHGAKPIDEELKEQLWYRSILAGLVLAVAAAAVPPIDFVIADWLEIPAGPVHIFFFLAYLSFAAWMLMYYFSLEDFFQGLIMLTIYWYVPVAILWLVALAVRNPLFLYVLGWLKRPEA